MANVELLQRHVLVENVSTKDSVEAATVSWMLLMSRAVVGKPATPLEQKHTIKKSCYWKHYNQRGSWIHQHHGRSSDKVVGKVVGHCTMHVCFCGRIGWFDDTGTWNRKVLSKRPGTNRKSCRGIWYLESQNVGLLSFLCLVKTYRCQTSQYESACFLDAPGTQMSVS